MREIIQEALSKGVEMHVAGEFDLANQLYASVLKLLPNHADANHNMGLLKLDSGNELEALPYLQTALQADTTIAQFWLSYIKALIKIERLDDAARILDLAQESGFRDEEFLDLRQLLNAPAEKASVPETEINVSTDTKPNILDTLKLDKALKLAKKYIKDAKTEDAKHIYQDILIKFPKNLRAQRSLAALSSVEKITTTEAPPQEAINQLIYLYEGGQMTEMLEKAQKVLEQYPSSYEVWNFLGMASKRLLKTDVASRAFKKVTELNPNYADGFSNLGIALEDEGNLKEAVEAYTKAVTLNPKHAEAYYNMGNALGDQGKLDEAIEVYQKAIIIKPDYYWAYNNLGVTLHDQGKMGEAIKAYKKAISLKAHYPEAHNNIGLTFKEQGKLEEAIKAYSKAISIKHDYVDAYINMGLALKDQGKLEEAITAYEQALNLYPNNAQVYNNIGNVLRDQGKLEEAIDAYNKAISIQPNNTFAHLNITETLKMDFDFSSEKHILYYTDGKVRETGKKLQVHSSDEEIASYLRQAFDHINNLKIDYQTPLSQIYKRNAVDLNCSRHTKIFSEADIIPEFCFGCFKVQVEVKTLFSLIRLTKLFYDMTFKQDLTRKTMIEMRPEIHGFYKGLFYCRGLDQAQELKAILDTDLYRAFGEEIVSQIKRGCSEFPLKFPDYGKIENANTTIMSYPSKWKAKETLFDQNNWIKSKTNLIPSSSEFCLSDFFIVQKWIDYAKGLGDPSSVWFQDNPIVFQEVFENAVQRKRKFAKVF